MARKRKRQGIVYCLIPIMGLLFIFHILPILGSFAVSFTDLWRGHRIVGLENYRALFRNPIVRKAFVNTFYFTGVAVPVNIALSLGIALMISYIPRFRTIFRTVYFLPVVTSMVGAAIVWRWLYQPQFGLFNELLQLVGLKPLKWLISERLALPSIMIMSVWKNIGYNIVLFLAALRGIPVVFYEAARVDGANFWQQLKRVTIPLLKPALLFITVTTMIGALQIFTEIYVMTQSGSGSGAGSAPGGPENATTVVVLVVQERGFRDMMMGYASAIAFVLFIIIMVMTYVALRLLRTEWSY